MPPVTTKLDRRFMDTRVDPNDPVAFAKWMMDVNLLLDDISRITYSTAPLASNNLSLAPYLKSSDASAAYETIAHALSTYLKITDAALTYLRIADAATTYLAKTEIKRGSVALSGGTATVNTAGVTANSLIQLTVNGAGANLGIVYEDTGSRVAGASFVIKSSNVLDDSTVAWQIMEP